jgi:hypothetical protein
MQLTIFPVAIISLLVVGASLIIIANMFFYTILEEVNGTRPTDQQISMLGVNIKYGRVLRAHSQLFPQSAKRKQMRLLGLGGFLLIGAAFVLDIIHYAR